MKIDKDKFNKLKQLDRIEFRQKYDIIQGIRFNVVNYVYYVLIIALIFMTGAIISNDALLINLSATFFNLTFFLMFVCIIGMGATHVLRSKKLKELNEEYFQVEVKK